MILAVGRRLDSCAQYLPGRIWIRGRQGGDLI